MTKILTAALLAVLTLTLGACGSVGIGGNDDAKAATSISAQLMKDQKAGTATSRLITFKKKDADCISKHTVDKVGTDKLQKDGLLDKNMKTRKSVTAIKFSARDADKIAAGVTSCVNVKKSINQLLDRAGNVPPKTKACISKALNDSVIRGVLSKGFQGRTSEIQQDLSKPIAKCATGSQG